MSDSALRGIWEIWTLEKSWTTLLVGEPPRSTSLISIVNFSEVSFSAKNKSNDVKNPPELSVLNVWVRGSFVIFLKDFDKTGLLMILLLEKFELPSMMGTVVEIHISVLCVVGSDPPWCIFFHLHLSPKNKLNFWRISVVHKLRNSNISIRVHSGTWRGYRLDYAVWSYPFKDT